MQEHSRYAVGLDIGTSTVRAVVAYIDQSTGAPTIVGVGSVPSGGMRKGEVIQLDGPARAIDDALAEAERASGHQVERAAVAINGSSILSTHVSGMIAVGSAGHEIGHEDIDRLKDVATVGKVPPNRQIIDLIPHSYRLDDQAGIKDPIDMTGTRLELDARVISVLAPQYDNLQKSLEIAKVSPSQVVTPSMAAARATLSQSQVDNGVGLIDIGGATTNLAVYEDGDMQFTAVLPVGGINITNDLAIGLKIDPALAEQVKLKHALAVERAESEMVTLKHDGQEVTFSTKDVDDIVDARLEEIFESIQKILKKAGYAEKLPSGIVLVGGTANLKGISEYAKQALGLAAQVGKTADFGSVESTIKQPEYAVAIGLMLLDSTGNMTASSGRVRSGNHAGGPGLLGRAANIFKKAFGGDKE